MEEPRRRNSIVFDMIVYTVRLLAISAVVYYSSDLLIDSLDKTPNWDDTSLSIIKFISGYMLNVSAIVITAIVIYFGVKLIVDFFKITLEDLLDDEYYFR